VSLSRLRRVVASLPAETRPDFKRIDASPVAYDDGSWLEPSLSSVTIRPLA
jgi:hypothetical protein